MTIQHVFPNETLYPLELWDESIKFALNTEGSFHIGHSICDIKKAVKNQSRGRKLASAWQQDSISGCVFSFIHSYIFSYIHPYIFPPKLWKLYASKSKKFSSVSEENCPLVFVWEFLMRHEYVKRQKKRSWEPFRTSEHGNIPANRVIFCQRQTNH